MAIKEWEEISRKEVFGKYGRKVEEVIFKLPNGRETDFLIKKEGKVVCTLALTESNEVIMARQFRPGPKKILLELPGGGIDKDEEPREAAVRELLEETGYKGEMKYVGQCLDDAYSTIERHCFVATGCKKVGEVSNPEEEWTEIELVDLPKFREILRSGQMTDIEVGYLGLDFLGLL